MVSRRCGGTIRRPLLLRVFMKYSLGPLDASSLGREGPGKAAAVPRSCLSFDHQVKKSLRKSRSTRQGLHKQSEVSQTRLRSSSLQPLPSSWSLCLSQQGRGNSMSGYTQKFLSNCWRLLPAAPIVKALCQAGNKLARHFLWLGQLMTKANWSRRRSKS